MSEQDLQDLFEDLDIASKEKRTYLKQKHYIFLYGSSSKSAKPAKQVLEDIRKADEIYENFRRHLCV